MPCSSQSSRMLGGVCVGVLPVVGLGEVDLDDVVRRSLQELRPVGRVDHVVRGRDQIVEVPGAGRVVVQGAKRLDVGHGGGRW